ncbi:class F sortase [Nocardiopsis terrae]
MGRHSRPSRGRRGSIITAAATVACAGIGTVLLTLGMTEEQSLPRPPVAATGPAQPSIAPSPTDPPSGTEDVAPLPRSAPVALTIPAIELHTTHLVELGLTPERRLEAPREWQAVGWYARGAAPGQTGPAVLAGHLDSVDGPAVFHRLGGLRPGDRASVHRADGTSAEFTVYAVESHPKDAFPTDSVYEDTRQPELRLITCGGGFDAATGHYTDNVIVYARLAAEHDRQGTPSG